ncbi:hypothetical protein C8Q77DRAFT_1091799 [Trametes polyzona]|nr:hypothetical protein C8Q77DRAFT_1091799 [Trametes polyzona]
MNNDDGNGQRHYSQAGELVPFAVNPTVTPEDYRANMERVQQLKAAISMFEEQNQHGLQRYYEERQALEAAVEQGRLAAQRLAQFNGQPSTSMFPASAAPVAGPSSGAVPQFHPQYLAGPAVYSEAEVPTSARIVEVPSPQVDRATPAGSAQQNQHYRPELYQQHPQIHQQQQYANVYAAANRNMHPAQMHGSFAAVTPVGAQHVPYQSGQWAQSASMSHHAYRSTAHHHGLAQQVQSSHTTHGGRPVPSRTPGPQPSPDAHTSTQAHATQAAQGSRQPRHSSGVASSSNSAPSTSSDPTYERVPHSKVTYSSQGNQAAPNVPDNSGAQRIDPLQEEQLFQLFKGLSPPAVKRWMLQLLAAVERKQSGRAMTTAELEAEKVMDAKMKQILEVVSDKLKPHPISVIKSLFQRYWIRLKHSEQNNPMQRQAHPAAQQALPTSGRPPSTSERAPSATTSTAATAPATLSAMPSNRSNAAPSASSALPTDPTRSHASTTQATFGRKISAAEHPQLAQYVSRQPGVPLAYRDANGNIRYVYPPQLPDNVLTATAANAPAVPSFVHYMPRPMELGSQAPQPSILQSTMGPPGTPELVEIHPPSQWTPEKVDRRRLAADILRSLGRPRGSFGDPLVTTTSPPVVVEEIQPKDDNKRKAPPSPRPSTPLKRQRTEDIAANASEVVIPSTDVIDLTASTSEEENVSETRVATPEPPEAPAAPPRQPSEGPIIEEVDEPARSSSPAPAQEVEGGPEEPTVPRPDMHRGASVMSSDTADVDNVQAMFAAPVSDAEGPPSSAKASSPAPEAPEMVDLPSIDARLFATDTSETLNATVAASASPKLATDTERPRTTSPARGDKLPLFLPSPSSSPSASGSVPAASRDASPGDEVLSDGETAPRALYGPRKDKGKARATSVDIDLTEWTSSPPGSLPRRTNLAYVEVPPLPEYARRLREPSPADTSASVSENVDEESVDELAEWHGTWCLCGSWTSPQCLTILTYMLTEEEMRAAVQLSYERMHESPCLWHECPAVLNSLSRLQEHATLHASENMEWGTYGCRWQNCTSRFTEEAKLAQHLRKHAMAPLPCPFDGCEKTFNTDEALLAHQKSSKHRQGTLRARTAPFAPAENGRALSPLPDVLPAYMSVPRRVSRHPISKERHQWLGPKVLENITAFKYTGGRSNAAEAARGSRRLAEKVAAAELAGVAPEAALEQIKRWIDDEYLLFADGYDAVRHRVQRCAEIPAQEVTKLVDEGLVLWPPPEDVQEQESASVARRSASGGPWTGTDGGADKDAGADEEMHDTPGPEAAGPRAQDPPSPPDADASMADDSEGSGVDQLADGAASRAGDDIASGTGPAAAAAAAASASPDRHRAGDGDPGGGHGGIARKVKLKLPRRSNSNGVAPSQTLTLPAGAPETVPGGWGSLASSSPGPGAGTGSAPATQNASRDRGGGGGGAAQARAEEVKAEVEMEQRSPWPIWPPPPAGRGGGWLV